MRVHVPTQRGFTRRIQGLHQHALVADVIGQQQYQFGVHGVALLGQQISVRVDQRFVKIVGRVKIRLGVQNLFQHDVAFAMAAFTAACEGARQRAQTCWSGRSK